MAVTTTLAGPIRNRQPHEVQTILYDIRLSSFMSTLNTDPDKHHTEMLSSTSISVPTAAGENSSDPSRTSSPANGLSQQTHETTERQLCDKTGVFVRSDEDDLQPQDCDSNHHPDHDQSLSEPDLPPLSHYPNPHADNQPPPATLLQDSRTDVSTPWPMINNGQVVRDPACPTNDSISDVPQMVVPMLTLTAPTTISHQASVIQAEVAPIPFPPPYRLADKKLDLLHLPTLVRHKDWFEMDSRSQEWANCITCNRARNPNIGKLTMWRPMISPSYFSDTNAVAYEVTPERTRSDDYTRLWCTRTPLTHGFPAGHLSPAKTIFRILMGDHIVDIAMKSLENHLARPYIMQSLRTALEKELIAQNLLITPMEISVNVMSGTSIVTLPLHEDWIFPDTTLMGQHCHKFVLACYITMYRHWTPIMQLLHESGKDSDRKRKQRQKLLQQRVLVPIAPKPAEGQQLLMEEDEETVVTTIVMETTA